MINFNNFVAGFILKLINSLSLYSYSPNLMSMADWDS